MQSQKVKGKENITFLFQTINRVVDAVTTDKTGEKNSIKSQNTEKRIGQLISLLFNYFCHWVVLELVVYFKVILRYIYPINIYVPSPMCQSMPSPV